MFKRFVVSLAILAGSIATAYAGDPNDAFALAGLPVKAPAAVAPSICTYVSCTGPFAGANITQIGEQNASVLNLGNISGSGFYIGAHGGYQLLTNNFLLAAFADVSYEVYAPASDPLAGTAFKDKLFAMEGIELGGNLASLFPNVATAIQLPTWMTPLVTGMQIAGCQHGSKLSGYCIAFAEHYYLPNTKWSFDAKVVNAQYGNTDIGKNVTTSTETRVDAGITYHF